MHRLADAYRRYAKEHKELYHFIMRMQTGSDDALKQAAGMIAEPCMHGFVFEEKNGYFSHYPVDLEESYHIAIDCLIDGIHHQEEKNNA